MGNRGKKRSKRKRHQHTWQTLIVQMPALELVKGHDGFMRGKPEPVLMTVAYGLHPDAVELLGRALRRPTVRGAFPVKIPIANPELFRGSLQLSCRRVVLVTLAFEEDSGADVEQVYSALTDPNQLLLWSKDTEFPSPVTLAEIDQLTLPAHGELPINLMLDQTDLGNLCQKDSLIGASLVVIPTVRGQWTRFLHFTDDQRRNDWTAQLQILI